VAQELQTSLVLWRSVWKIHFPAIVVAVAGKVLAIPGIVRLF
jgi:hypothetical protein